MEKKIEIWIKKFLRKQIELEEITQLRDLFTSGNAENQLSVFYEKAWEEASFVPEEEVEKRIWPELQKQIHTTGPTSAPAKYSLWKKSLRIAASILIPLFCAGLGYYAAKSTPDQRDTFVQNDNKMTVQVQVGQKAKIQLPDGTFVWLNSAGSLTYDNVTNKKERLVYLQGEAYFEVSKDETRPFIVKTDDISIEALGTSFNVKAYPDDYYVAATLMEGSVRIIFPGQTELLNPNEKLTIVKSNGQFTKNALSDAEKNISWINNQLAFEQERMEDIAKILERMYNVRILFASDKLKDIRYSGTIINNNLENVLQLIEFVSPIRYSMEKNATILIREK